MDNNEATEVEDAEIIGKIKLMSTILSQNFKICHQLHHSNNPSGTLKISSTQTCTRTSTISQWYKCIPQNYSNSPRRIRRNNLSQIKSQKPKRKIQTDLSYQWCDYRPNFATFVENLTTQQKSMLVATETTRTRSKLSVSKRAKKLIKPLSQPLK